MAEEVSAKITFTEGESSLLMAIMQNLTSEIQFDADAIAQQLGYKDGSIVKTRWGQIKRKKLTAAGASPGGGIKKRTSAKKNTAKKGKGYSETNGGGDDEEPATPTKTPAKRGRKPKVEKVAEEDQEEIKQEEKEDAVETTESAEAE
ncbi:hypothetical protein LTR37_006215 [Vermiconidia calcicola]|uniref:Uncharacterized protein n=1 Tax=Vermiconidia calcicola TaxID=1690605 RepID=A0ACC3NH27_9PEZI|nr:hypothetical protein LTR37_006215 [Vermiconidia calcicola]